MEGRKYLYVDGLALTCETVQIRVHVTRERARKTVDTWNYNTSLVAAMAGYSAVLSDAKGVVTKVVCWVEHSVSLSVAGMVVQLVVV